MLELHMHPLASYCWKVLLALYETDTPFTPRVIDLADPAQRAELVALWPFAKFPVLRDLARGEVVPESTIIIGPPSMRERQRPARRGRREKCWSPAAAR